MKYLKIKTVFIICSLVLLQFSCSKEDITIQEPTSSSYERTVAKEQIDENQAELDKRYHFIRFNVENKAKYRRLITKLKYLTKYVGGEILTLGMPDECLERVCKEVNIVIEFPTEEIGEIFFSIYEAIIQPIADKATSDLAYHSAASFQIPGVFDNTIENNYFLVVNLNHLDLPRYIEDFARPTVGQLLQTQGILLSDDFRTQKCLLGDCFEYSVLIGFPNEQLARDWFFSDAQQTLQRIGEEITEEGSVLFAPEF